MKVIAFLQCPNFTEQTDQDYRKRYVADQVFHRSVLLESMSGYRLRQAFGPFYDKIWWDNVDPYNKGIDMRHVDRVIAVQKPDLILAFGKQANETITKSVMAIRRKVMRCHHPNARFKTQSDLDNFAQEVRTWVMTQELEAE